MRKKTEKKKNSFTVTLNTFKYFFPATFRYKPMFVIWLIIKTIIVGIRPMINVIFPALVIDELIGAQRIEYLVLYVGITVVGNVIIGLADSLISVHLEKYKVLLNNYFAIERLEKTMTMDFALTENTESLDQIRKANEGMDWYSDGVYGITMPLQTIVSSIITIVGVAGLIAINAPLLLIVIGIVLLVTTLINKKLNKLAFENYTGLSQQNRIFGYFFYEIADFSFGKDIRLYDASEMMLQNANDLTNLMSLQWKKFSKKSNNYQQINNALTGIYTGVNLLYLGWLTIIKAISIANFTMMTTASLTLLNSLNTLISSLMTIQQRCAYANEHIKFMQYPCVMKKGTQNITEQDHTIEFRHVSFKYPNSETYVLKDVSLTLSSGEHLSVVGLNGAGKTTFIKLLCRLYEVSEGEILVDGININEYDYDEYVKLFSVVFQDFRLFSYSINENITIGKQDENPQELYKLVGLDTMLEKLPKGADTILFKQFAEDAIEPSGGEQQKMAIARALYKNAPVVILDEPTAALDPIAEYEIYRQFDSLVGGKTAVYISHRLSSCKFCDKIAVFSEGTVKEYGTHDELVIIPHGIYAEMFEAQAQYYN